MQKTNTTPGRDRQGSARPFYTDGLLPLVFRETGTVPSTAVIQADGRKTFAGTVLLGTFPGGELHKRRRAGDQNLQRLNELERLIRLRRGRQTTLAVAEEQAFALCALPQLFHLLGPLRRHQYGLCAQEWLAIRLPRLWVDLGEEKVLDLIRRCAGRKPLKALTIGNRLSVTDEERKALDLRRIRREGQTDAIQKAERGEKARERERERRRKQGSTPREEAASRTKPWEAMGMSRASWYRAGKPTSPTLETSSCAISAPSGQGGTSPIAHEFVSAAPAVPEQGSRHRAREPAPERPPLGPNGLAALRLARERSSG